jgi:hypothetical protein
MRVLSEGGRCLLYCARPFGTANRTPLNSISRNLAPLGKLSWKVITQKCLVESSPQFIRGHLRGRGLSTQPIKLFLGPRINGIQATWPVQFLFISPGN